jgi:pimeloyl-ACP methyl ester carboxylesterase
VLRVAGGTIGVALQGEAAGRPLVLLPGIPGSARGLADLARMLGRARPVIALDLPGFGASALAAAPSGTLDAAAIAAAMRDALAQLGVTGFDTVACAESASIGAALAQGGTLLLLDPVPDAARHAVLAAMVDVTPRIDGTHLLAAWHQLRDATLWRPWFERTPGTAIDAGTDPDVARLHAVMTDWMRGGTAGAATLRAALAEPLPAAATALVAPGHPWAGAHGLRAIEAAEPPAIRAAAILAAL